MPRPERRSTRRRALLGAARLARRAGPVAGPLLLVLGTVAGLASAPAAWFLKNLVDRLSDPGGAAPPVLVLAAAAMLLTGVGQVAGYLASLPAGRLEVALQVRTERGLAEACARRTGTAFLDDPVEQDRLLLARRGAHEAPRLITDAATDTVSSTAGILAYVVLLWTSWPWMLAALAATTIPIAAIQRRISRRMLATTELAVTAYRWRDYYAELFTDPASARDMRLHGAQRLFVDRLANTLHSALEAERRQVSRNTVAQIGFTLLNAGVAAAGAVFVALAVNRGEITVGDFVLFTAAVAAVQARLVSLAGTCGQLAVSLGVFAHYLDVVEADPEPTGTAPAPPLRDAIEFDDVWFRYSSGGDWVLRGVSLRLPVGGTHALVGMNGAGKSTIVKLLLRYYEPTRGRIRWDGRDLREFDPASLRQRLAAVLQDQVAYELDAVENITVGDIRRFGDVAAARAAAERARVGSMIERLPDGFATMLSTRRSNEDGVGGVTLSGGQWQRMGLARALMCGDADLVILDEPNSGLDPVAEHELHLDLMTRSVGRTRLLISHRLGALRHAEQIIVLSDGVVAECGTHDELMAAGATYCGLFTLQARPYAERLVTR
jgi:ATP-binding cassette subfamily B protein